MHACSVQVTAPRPESYGVDVELACSVKEFGDLPPAAAAMNLGQDLFRSAPSPGAACSLQLRTRSCNATRRHRNVAAACESGWDFSSRWFED